MTKRQRAKLIGPALRRRRRRLGLTQQQLAVRIGRHVITVSKWERGALRMSGTAADFLGRFFLMAERRRP